MRNRSLVSLAAVVSFAGPAFAQNSPVMSPAAAIPEWRSFIGANPLGIPFDIVAVEAETSVGAASTLGAVVSYNDIDNTRFTTLDARYKYYPGEVAMRGFSVGISGGMTKFRGGVVTTCDFNGCTSTGPNTLNAATVGVLVDYNWTQGPSQKFVIGTGIGAKRVLASPERRETVGLERAYVTGRFVIGLLF